MRDVALELLGRTAILARIGVLGATLALLAAACTSTPPAISPAVASMTPTPASASPATAPATHLASPAAEPSASDLLGGALLLEAPQLHGALLAGDDALWAVVQDAGERSIVRLDPGTNSFETVVENLPVLPNPIHGMAVNGSIWMSSWDRGTVTEYDAVTGAELAEHQVGLHPIEPVYAFGDIWTLNHDGASVTRIDTDAKQVASSIELDPGAQPLWAHSGGGLLWVAAVTDKVFGIDPSTNAVSRTIGAGIGCVTGVSYVADRLLVGSCDAPGTHLFDSRSGESLGVLDQPFGGAQPLEVDGLLWLPRASEGDYIDGLVAVDPQSLEAVDDVDLGIRLSEGGYQVAFDSIWISGREGVVRVSAEALSER